MWERPSSSFRLRFDSDSSFDFVFFLKVFFPLFHVFFLVKLVGRCCIAFSVRTASAKATILVTFDCVFILNRVLEITFQLKNIDTYIYYLFFKT